MKIKPVIVKRGRKAAAPRNLAAKALASPLFRPKTTPDPKTYRRKGRYGPLTPPEEPADE